MSVVSSEGRSMTTDMLRQTYSSVMGRFQTRLSDMSVGLGIEGGLVATSGQDGEIGLCIDGRPQNKVGILLNQEIVPSEEKKIHFPGGVYGIFVAVQKQTGWTAEETVEIVKSALGQEIWLHTDNHSKDTEVGCAYAKTLMDVELARKLGVDPVKAKEIWEEIYPSATIAEYQGPHQEHAAFIVQSEDITIVSPHKNGQAFVYDQARMRHWIMNTFGPRILQKIPQLNVEQLWKDLDQQAIASLRLLTAPKTGVHGQLPIYEIAAKGKEVIKDQIK